MNLAERRAATQRTLGAFSGRSFSWRDGVTCIHLARHHAIEMGHIPPPMPAFRSALGAKRSLAKAGVRTVNALLDRLWPAIPPANAWIGDLVAVEGDQSFTAIGVYSGNGAALMFHEDAGDVLAVARVAQFRGAWRL